MKELWDAYDRNFHVIEGITLVRGEEDKIPEGTYHLLVDIAVRHVDGTYLLMQRDWKKKGWPGWWELTAGGSALKGESPLTAAQRELEEETGLIASNFTEIGRVVKEDSRSLHVTFLCEIDCDKGNIRLQEGETIDYKWVTEDELRKERDRIASPRAFRFLEISF